MTRTELESLAAAKQTTPEKLRALIADQAWFMEQFNQKFSTNPGIEFRPCQTTSEGAQVPEERR